MRSHARRFPAAPVTLHRCCGAGGARPNRAALLPLTPRSNPPAPARAPLRCSHPRGAAAESESDPSADEAEEEEEEEGKRRRRNRVVRPVAYNYSFFHLTFALASCYSAMLMTDWGSGSGSLKEQVGVGWASVWVKMASQWVTVACYVWSLVAPMVLSDRDFS